MKSRVRWQRADLGGALREWASLGNGFAPWIITMSTSVYGLAFLLQPESIIDDAGGFRTVLTPGGRALYQLGMTGGIAWELGWWWTVFTATYLHSAWWHLVYSVYLWAVGGPTASAYGRLGTFVVFNVSGAVGFLVTNVWNGAPTLGAEGGVWGLVAALLLHYKRSRTDIMTRRVWWYVSIVLTLAVMGVLGSDEMQSLAPVGGLVGGAVAAQLLGARGEDQTATGVRLVALAIVAVVVLGMGLSFYNVTGILVAD